MAIQIEEIRAAALANESYSGTLNGQLAEFYRSGGGDPSDVLERLEELLQLSRQTSEQLLSRIRHPQDITQDCIINFR